MMNRAVARRAAFPDRRSSRRFLAQLAKAVRSGRIEVHAYSVLANHCHLLIRSPRGEMSEALRVIQNQYTKWFNRQLKRDGPLFRGRFPSEYGARTILKGELVGLSPADRKRRIAGRKKTLEKQIEKNQNELKKAQEKLDGIDKEIADLNKKLSGLGMAGTIFAPSTTEVSNNGGGLGDYAGAAVSDAIGWVDPGVLDVYDWIFGD